ncbi:MAG: hypothetical protein MPN21_18505 [Thermoanaerobaculia bacterium]|nr:hypothetical protein [Thermoanaerobaculia bacterium]
MAALVASLAIVPTSFGDELSQSFDGLEAEELHPNNEKTGPWCNPTGYYCTGTFSELIDHFFTRRDGRVIAWVTDFVNQAISAGTECSLEDGQFIEIRAEGGDKALLEQLYLSKLSGGEVGIRMQSLDGTPSGSCRLAYIRALYPDA